MIHVLYLDLQGEREQITTAHREEQIAHQDTKRQLSRLQNLYNEVKQRELELIRSNSNSIPTINTYSNRDPLEPINYSSRYLKTAHQSAANTAHQSVANTAHQSVANTAHQSAGNTAHQSAGNAAHQSQALNYRKQFSFR